MMKTSGNGGSTRASAYRIYEGTGDDLAQQMDSGSRVILIPDTSVSQRDPDPTERIMFDLTAGTIDRPFRDQHASATALSVATHVAVIGSVSEQPGQCYYRDRYGRRYIDSCPSGY